MPRERRRFKTGGSVVSFGDLMLPLVGLIAIGLLFVAGKTFYFSYFQAERQPVPVTFTPLDAPRADAGEGVPGEPHNADEEIREEIIIISTLASPGLGLDIAGD